MDDLDRILSSDEPLQPSSGFRASVMAAVREAAAEPPPLRFPWARLTLGLAACAVLAAAGTALAPQAAPLLAPFSDVLRPLVDVAPHLGYAALAVLMSLAAARLPRLFIRS